MDGQELKNLLTGQSFDDNELSPILEDVKGYASAYAKATNGISVISDFQLNSCYIYSGAFGQILGLSESYIDTNTAFEEEIFNKVPHEELIQRHILELRYFHFLETVPVSDKTNYAVCCLMHFQVQGQRTLPVFHTTRYVELDSKGNAWLGLCTYAPFQSIPGFMDGYIINTCTGETICLKQSDNKLLSKRQLEILSLLAAGYGSKQIADKLCISVYTVSRHRQNILTKLKVKNTTAAVEIGLRMNLIDL